MWQDKLKISIIIPFRDRVDLLEKCVSSILKKSTYQDYEILLVNNESKKEETYVYIKSISSNPRVVMLNYKKQFNFSAINNFAVRHAKGEFVLFLNNDTEVITENWLEEMIEHIKKPNVGAVGAKLLYPDGTIQHAGIILNENIAIHIFSHIKDSDFKKLKEYNKVRNWSAVTAACMMTKRQLFIQSGGFNEKNLPIAYNDVDYCLKLMSKGYKIVWTPKAELYHYEAATRGLDTLSRFLNPKRHQKFLQEQDYMRKKWKSIIKNDPNYNTNL